MGYISYASYDGREDYLQYARKMPGGLRWSSNIRGKKVKHIIKEVTRLKLELKK
jgi:hypothetical protein